MSRLTDADAAADADAYADAGDDAMSYNSKIHMSERTIVPLTVMFLFR